MLPQVAEVGRGGFALERGLPHGEFAWAVRRSPRVAAVFRALHPEAAAPLVVSQDVVFFANSEHDAPCAFFVLCITRRSFS